MRISDWSSDVCSSDLLGGRDRSDDAEQRAHALEEGGQAGDRARRPLLDLLIGQARQAILDLVPALDDPAAALRHLEGDALGGIDAAAHADDAVAERREVVGQRSEEHTSELQSLMRNSYA